jgi:hypothetical protein
MTLQATPTNGATAEPKPDEWDRLPPIDNTFVNNFVRDLKAGRTVVNSMLQANRADARALVVELDRAGTLVGTMTAIERLKLQVDAAHVLLGLAQLRFNAAIMMGPPSGERSGRSKRRAA